MTKQKLVSNLAEAIIAVKRDQVKSISISRGTDGTVISVYPRKYEYFSDTHITLTYYNKDGSYVADDTVKLCQELYEASHFNTVFVYAHSVSVNLHYDPKPKRFVEKVINFFSSYTYAIILLVYLIYYMTK